jgi:hypothetical protein
MSIMATNDLLAVNSLVAANSLMETNYLTLPMQTIPTFSPVAGAYTGAQSVTITSSGATAIYYTLDGSAPDLSSTLYTGAVTVAISETLKAIAVQTGYAPSYSGSAAYIITQATPTFSPIAGSYTGSQSVTITSSGADTIYYTTDGSTPTISSSVYTVPITVSASETVKALAVKAGALPSAIGSAAYIITYLQAPVFVASIGVVNSAATAAPNNDSITGATGGAHTIDTTGATLLVAFVRAGGSPGYPPTTPLDSATAGGATGYNTWTLAGSTGTATAACAIYYCISPSTSTTHWFDNAGHYGAMEVYAFSGVGTWSVDVAPVFAGSYGSSPFTIASINPAQNNEVIIAGFTSNELNCTSTVNDSFSGGQGVSAGVALAQNINTVGEVGASAYLIDSSHSAIGPTFTSSPYNTDTVTSIVAFKLS